MNKRSRSFDESQSSDGDKKVLIVVLSLDQEPWRSIEAVGQRQTWASAADRAPTIDTVWLQGETRGPVRLSLRVCLKVLKLMRARRLHSVLQKAAARWSASRPVTVVGDTIITGVPETYIHTNAKTIAGFRHLLRTRRFDYILRTNSSTYIDQHSLLALVNGLASGPYYGGPPAIKGVDHFASGTSMLLSRAAVSMIVEDKAWEYDLIDDLAIGRSMSRSGVPLQPLGLIDILTEADLDRFEPERLSDVFAVRCKGSDTRAHDVVAMHAIHALYKGLRSI